MHQFAFQVYRVPPGDQDAQGRVFYSDSTDMGAECHPG